MDPHISFTFSRIIPKYNNKIVENQRTARPVAVSNAESPQQWPLAIPVMDAVAFKKSL